MAALLRTKAQIKRDIRHKRIVELFHQIQNEFPNESMWRYSTYIADKEGLTEFGVRKILMKYDLYHPRERKKKRKTRKKTTNVERIEYKLS